MIRPPNTVWAFLFSGRRKLRRLACSPCGACFFPPQSSQFRSIALILSLIFSANLKLQQQQQS
ncbi:hypothetical protein BEN74_11085 [Acinetobacter sp. WCHAc010034]|nr:hypothetical protein BEN74_11085 [Acinetobacter sp. WCHAc010034]